MEDIAGKEGKSRVTSEAFVHPFTLSLHISHHDTLERWILGAMNVNMDVLNNLVVKLKQMNAAHVNLLS
jgi:hypothetical protein